jgi:hypothetical protein
MPECATNWKKQTKEEQHICCNFHYISILHCFIDFINDFFLALFVFALNKLDLVYQMPTQCKEPK